MKTFLQAIALSILIHAIFVIVFIIIGYTKVVNYTPEIMQSIEYSEPSVLQNKVIFGATSSPFIYFFTFIALTAICCLVIMLYKRVSAHNK